MFWKGPELNLSGDIEQSKDREISLADTCADGFKFIAPDSVEADKACLLQIYPASSESELLRLSRERTLIGREPSCDVTVNDDAMSRVHAAIDLIGHCYFLTDLDSTNGTYVDDELLRGRVPLSGGELIRMGGCILKFMSSMDQEANYHAVVRELMSRDSLTNAFNRSYLVSVMERELECSRTQQTEFSVILLDIDHFKKINDDHGHLIGDEVLRIFCERIRNALRRNDILARFGGEEFVIGCSQTSLKDAGRIAERVRLAISSTPFATQAGNISVTCSLGVASSDGATIKTSDDLISAADALMYSAKNQGRNCVEMLDRRNKS